jgi:rubrerythrin
MATETEEIKVAADAMCEERRRLIAQPLARIWGQLARAGLEAADRYRKVVKQEMCKHEGRNVIGTDWYCPACGKSNQKSRL